MRTAVLTSDSLGKAESVIACLRKEIVSGRLPLGSQLDTWDALEDRFQVGRATLMRAMAKLKSEGFIYAASTRGTFVSQRPPHLCRYALAFQGRPGLPGWNRFWRALANVAAEVKANSDRDVPVFFNINGHLDQPEHRRLLEDAAADRLAGVIFVGPGEAMSPKLLESGGVPAVAIDLRVDNPNCPSVYPDFESFVDRTTDYFARRKRKRVAVLTPYADDFASFPQAIAAKGMETRPWWQLPVNAIAPNAAFAVTRLLLDGRAPERPDALVICDDNMVESAMAAIVDAGIRVPDELDVVTECNWQEPLPTVLPAKRLGYDAKAVLAAAINVIDIQRQGGKPPMWTGIKAQFEEELGSRS